MDDFQSVTMGETSYELGTGLLGVTIRAIGDGYDGKRLEQKRLEEIERRVLAIEEKLQALEA